MLIDFHDVWCATRLPKAKTRRAQQHAITKLRLPVIRAGHSVMIDDEAGDARLRELALHQDHAEPERRGRGRPKKLTVT
jgi:hypothetical protein